jgi:hypothetical protein
VPPPHLHTGLSERCHHERLYLHQCAHQLQPEADDEGTVARSGSKNKGMNSASLLSHMWLQTFTTLETGLDHAPWACHTPQVLKASCILTQ